jgi:hypothetical protein
LPVHLLIIDTEDFIVFLDEVYDVDWKTSAAFDGSHADIWEECGAVLNRVSFLHAIPIAHLGCDQRLGFRRMLGEAVARAFEGNTGAAEHILSKAEEFVTARNHEHARYWYLSAAALATALLLLVSLVLWIERAQIVSHVGQGLFDIFVAFGVGTVGALLSTFSRVAKLPLNPSAGRRLHYFEGAAHIVLGGRWCHHVARGCFRCACPANHVGSSRTNILVASMHIGWCQRENDSVTCKPIRSNDGAAAFAKLHPGSRATSSAA